MARKVWTAAELEQMTPAQQQEIFEQSIVMDLSQAPAEFLANVRADVEEHIARHDAQRFE